MEPNIPGLSSSRLPSLGGTSQHQKKPAKDAKTVPKPQEFSGKSSSIHPGRVKKASDSDAKLANVAKPIKPQEVGEGKSSKGLLLVGTAKVQDIKTKEFVEIKIYEKNTSKERVLKAFLGEEEVGHVKFDTFEYYTSYTGQKVYGSNFHSTDLMGSSYIYYGSTFQDLSKKMYIDFIKTTTTKLRGIGSKLMQALLETIFSGRMSWEDCVGLVIRFQSILL